MVQVDTLRHATGRRGLLTVAAGLAVLPVAPARPQPRPSGFDLAKFDRPGTGSVNSYLLLARDRQVIVDCQRTTAQANRVVALARGIGLPVEAIVLTHEHPDHLTGLDTVARAFPQAPILAGEITRDFIARDGADMLANMRRLLPGLVPERLPAPTRVLRDGETLSLAGVDWRVDEFGPGEARGMTLLHAPAEDVLIIADLVANRCTPYLLEGTTDAWIAALERALPRYAGVATALPGHGGAAAAAGLMEAQLAYLQNFRALVRGAMRDGAVPEAALRALRVAIEARYPAHPPVAGLPDLTGLNIAAVARELAGRPPR